MSEFYQHFETMKRFVGFTDQDAANLVALAPVFARHGPGITDRFYATLVEYPETARMIEGRVDALKATHARWMAGLFGGDYGQSYFEERLRIGATHVRVGLDPSWVEGVVSMLRGEGLEAIQGEIADPATAVSLTRSYLRILDLDLFIIGAAYAAERLERLSKFTGMNKRLIENVIRIGGKK